MMALFLAILPTLLQIVGWIIDKYAKDEATKKAFLSLIERAKMDPAICLQMKDSFASMDERLKKGGGK